jgi:hypothetical protein
MPSLTFRAIPSLCSDDGTRGTLHLRRATVEIHGRGDQGGDDKGLMAAQTAEGGALPAVEVPPVGFNGRWAWPGKSGSWQVEPTIPSTGKSSRQFLRQESQADNSFDRKAEPSKGLSMTMDLQFFPST